MRTVVPANVWAAWYAANQAAYEHVDTRITQLQEFLEAVGHESEQARAFRQHKRWLAAWRAHLTTIEREKEDAFVLSDYPANCGFRFGSTKEIKVELVKRDRLAARDADEIKQEVVTVECSAPLSVSGGFGFSSIEEREFKFVQSTKTVVDDMGNESQVVINRFGFENLSSFRMVPVILLNTRFWEPSDTIAAHASAGAAVDIKSGEAGTDVEFIVGPSLSFWRTFFVTGGLHVGRVPSLAGGFNIDDEVPEGVDAPPIEKTWKKAFVVTFSYKIR
jgi:hypothetical protein